MVDRRPDLPSARGSVPRETSGRVGVPAPPPVAAEVFGDGLPTMQAYAELLAGPGVTRGLLGPREVPRLWERHLLNCAAVAPLMPRDAAVVDVGSGAGLPGLVLAVCRPDLDLLLAEPLLRRARFLAEAIEALGLPNVRVERARAEDLAVAADVVTARAVAPLDRLARWTLPLLGPGGRLVALKGESAAQEVRAAAPVLERLGATSWEVLEISAGPGLSPTRAVVVEAGGPVREAGPARRRGGTRRRTTSRRGTS